MDEFITLHLACRQGAVKTAQRCLDRGVFVDTIDEELGDAALVRVPREPMRDGADVPRPRRSG